MANRVSPVKTCNKWSKADSIVSTVAGERTVSLVGELCRCVRSRELSQSVGLAGLASPCQAMLKGGAESFVVRGDRLGVMTEVPGVARPLGRRAGNVTRWRGLGGRQSRRRGSVD